MGMFPFSQRRELLVFTCSHILEDGRPILLVTHHEDDSNWQFLCGGETHDDASAVIVSLGELLDLDPTIEDICDLPLDSFAMRSAVGEKWYVRKLV